MISLFILKQLQVLVYCVYFKNYFNLKKAVDNRDFQHLVKYIFFCFLLFFVMIQLLLFESSYIHLKNLSCQSLKSLKAFIFCLFGLVFVWVSPSSYKSLSVSKNLLQILFRIDRCISSVRLNNKCLPLSALFEI